MNIKFVLCTLLIIFSTCNSKTYEFYGEHFTASYKNCDPEALTAIETLIKAFEEAIQASGATILKYEYEMFPGNGFTAVFLLSESHASIHTYPEHNACFVDLFTCGHNCSYIKFHEILKRYLKPKDVDKTIHTRT